MNAAAPTIFLLVRLLLMAEDGTELLSEHQARIPAGGTGLVKETLSLEGLPGAIHIYLTPTEGAVTPARPGQGGEPDAPAPPLLVEIQASLWDHAGDAEAGKAPRETNTEKVEISREGSRLVQLAEDGPRERRLILSLSAPSPPDLSRPPPVGPPPEPGRISFRIETYRGTAGARELLERHLLMTVERSPVSWESRWKRPIPREDGSGIVYRDEGLTLRLLPVVTDSGWVSVRAELSALLYVEGATEPLTLSSRATRTLPMGIPFEVVLELPGEETPEPGVEGPEDRERQSIIVEITPYRPGG